MMNAEQVAVAMNSATRMGPPPEAAELAAIRMELAAIRMLLETLVARTPPPPKLRKLPLVNV